MGDAAYRKDIDLKKIMILGASYTQIPLYELGKKLGIHTTAMSIPGDYPGFKLSDEVEYADISDPEEVIRACKKHQVDGVVTCGLDLGMAGIGAACQTLALPGPSREAAQKASNKYAMKMALTSAGVSTAPFYRIHNEEELESAMEKMNFPVIIKAVDLMGSLGIYRSDTPSEARKNFKRTLRLSRKDYCLIEEFIVGEIFGCEAMMQNGKLLYFLPNNIEAFQGETQMPIGHSVPYTYQHLVPEIKTQVTKAIAALGLDNCPINCDLIRRGDQVFIIEMTGRSGANGIAEMVSLYYDIDYYEVILRLSLGEDVSAYFKEPRVPRANLTHIFYTNTPGRLKALENNNPPADDIYDMSFNINPGDRIRNYTNGRDRIGQVMIYGDTLDYCRKRLDEIRSNLRLQLNDTHAPVL